MNSVQLVGRLARDPERRESNSGATVAKFTIAVDRAYKKDGEATADFISCLAFNKTADFVLQYFTKGQRIGLTGRIQTGSYSKSDGTKVYTTDVIADRVEFVESKQSRENAQGVNIDDFMHVPDGLAEELPFA